MESGGKSEKEEEKDDLQHQFDNLLKSFNENFNKTAETTYYLLSSS